MYENCFAYRNEKGCVALNEMLCKTKGKCSFYKPKNQPETLRKNKDTCNP